MRRITSSDRGNVHKGGSSLGSVDLVMVGGWKWERDFSPIDPMALAYVDVDYSKAYLRHLIKADEILGLQICSVHNLAFYLWLVREARRHIAEGDFVGWKAKLLPRITRRL